jgi:type 1 fimbriae regulatory protein FimB/type 1 fimbriae regulatory protein FimE
LFRAGDLFRHAAGYKLANDGHDTRALQAYLGHKNIQHTAVRRWHRPPAFSDRDVPSGV